MSVVTGAVLLLLSTQLYRLTVVESASWRVEAEFKRLKEMKTRGPRGSIFDANGIPLATSEPAYSAVLLEKDATKVEEILPALSDVLTGHDQKAAAELVDDVKKRMKDQGWFAYEPLTIKRKLDPKAVSEFADRKGEFPGVILMIEGTRQYPQGSLAAANIGYVGAITAEELKNIDYKGYSGNELVGKDGLEMAYERELRGQEGKMEVVVDAVNKPVSGYNVTQALSGNNIHLTLQTKLQSVAEQALARQIQWIKEQNDKEAHPTRAALVVQDVNNGAILAMVSYPTFNPNVFVGGPTQELEKVLTDPLGPLNNWAINKFEPGSTYKMGVGLAALQLGAMGPYQQIHCAPTYFRDPTRANWTTYDQGMADVARALALSCDPYFYEAGYQLGIDRLHDFMAQFGFGKVTGIDLPYESHGTNPTKASYADRWYDGNVFSVGIGQGDVLTTPLQLANYTATIALRGTRFKPHLLQKITSPTGELLKQYEPEELLPVQAKPEYWTRIQDGMRQVITSPDGTGFTAFQGFPIPVAGKTGSAETGRHDSNALAVAYAPFDKPQIAVSVIVEGGAHGSWVAPIARAVMAEYFGIKDQIPPGVPTYRTPPVQSSQRSPSN